MTRDKKSLEFIFNNILDNEQKMKKIITASKVNNICKIFLIISLVIFILTIAIAYFKQVTFLSLSNKDLTNIMTILFILSIYISIFTLIIPEIIFIIKPKKNI